MWCETNLQERETFAMGLKELTEIVKQCQDQLRDLKKGGKMMSVAHDVTAMTLTGWENY